MKSITTIAADLVAALKEYDVHPTVYEELEKALNDKSRWATPAEMAKARAKYESGSIELDDDARASRVVRGETWVQAWVRVE